MHADTRSLRQEPRFTKFAFTQLLEWLDDGVSHTATRTWRSPSLVSHFDRRNRLSPHELRTKRQPYRQTLEKDGVIETRPPARYCYVVARFVLLEDIRRDYEWSGSTNGLVAAPGAPSTRC